MATPALVSGELYVRSTPALFQPGGVLANLDEAFQDLLVDSHCAGAPRRRRRPRQQTAVVGNTQQGEKGGGRITAGDENLLQIRQARRAILTSRNQKMLSLKAMKKMIHVTVKAKRLELRQAAAQMEIGLKQTSDFVDRQLRSLCINYARAMEEEIHTIDDHSRRDEIRLKQEMEHLCMIERLDLFALHVEHETQGSVVLQRLPPTHQQHIRCKAAACENVKPDFFQQVTNQYSGITVTNVYKIENHNLLRNFQKVAEDLIAPGKSIRGLFCTVPDDCLEHVVVFGMGRQGTTSALVKKGSSWVDVGAGVAQIGTTSFIDTLQRTTQEISFPRAFSRYSTLEELRTTGNIGGTAAGGGGEEEEDKCASSWKADSDSRIHFLGLCRVVMPGVQVVAPGDSIPSVTAAMLASKADCDAVYSAESDEYCLLNKDYVLPEFLVSYRFVPRRPRLPSALPASYQQHSYQDHHHHDDYHHHYQQQQQSLRWQGSSGSMGAANDSLMKMAKEEARIFSSSRIIKQHQVQQQQRQQQQHHQPSAPSAFKASSSWASMAPSQALRAAPPLLPHLQPPR